MKVLLDTCVWAGAMEELKEAGHDVEWVGHWERDPGDEKILSTAYTHYQVLVTLDKDFGELAVLRGVPHRGIVRLVNFRVQDQAPACRRALEKYGGELSRGALITVEPGWIRIRHTPDE